MTKSINLRGSPTIETPGDCVTTGRRSLMGRFSVIHLDDRLGAMDQFASRFDHIPGHVSF